jgi:uncharacterized protein (DUF433 family)
MTKSTAAVFFRADTSDLSIEAGVYVLTKRFSSKEQQRLVMAAIYDPTKIGARLVGFENHLNYFQKQGKGLPADPAKGLALYLNSTLVDQYFRLFSGHTQVNATDLRKMSYPTYQQLLRLGAYVKDTMPDQETIDAVVEKECESQGRRRGMCSVGGAGASCSEVKGVKMFPWSAQFDFGPCYNIQGKRGDEENIRMDRDDLAKRVTVNRDVMVGKPTIRGMRITVEQILKALAGGLSPRQVLEDYPDLEEEDIKAALLYASELVEEESVFLIGRR